MTLRFEHHDIDELAAALALGAVDADEARAAREHLATDAEPHAELRSFLGVDGVLAAGLDPVEPSAALRDRLMGSIATTPQAAPPSEPAPSVGGEPRRGWLDWLSPRVARPLALAGVAAAVVLAVVSISLSGQLTERDQALRQVASAISGGQAAHRVEGDAGRGYVVDTPGTGSAFVVADVGALDANQLYELWLIGADGAPVDVGTFRPSGEAVAVIPVEQDLAGFTTFAVTVESERVQSPTPPIVMVGELGG
jgi:anti-sigma-K factor RskA